MELEIATSLAGLESEMKRLGELCAGPAGEANAALRSAHADIARAIAALHEAAGLAAGRTAMIEPRTAAETFRTKVKLKIPEPITMAATGAVALGNPGCDLTRIRGIDRGLAVKLAALGIASFAEIAGWSHLDVRRISDALGLGRRINRQNWIEQAALLASGHLSHHTRRLLAGDFSAMVAAPVVEPLPEPHFTPWRTPPAIVPAPMSSPIADQRPTFALSQAFIVPVEKFAEAAAAEAAVVASPKLGPTAKPETAITAALGRVAALEQELAAQIANDTAAATRPALTSTGDYDDLEAPEFEVGEADVVIVKQRQKPTAARHIIARPLHSQPPDNIDPETYAAYRTEVEEARVEIVQPGIPARPPVAAATEPAPDPEHRVIKRLLRPFSRKS